MRHCRRCILSEQGYLRLMGILYPGLFSGFHRQQRRYTSLRLRTYIQQLWKTCGTCLSFDHYEPNELEHKPGHLKYHPRL
jgi:hypothetical protein